MPRTKAVNITTNHLRALESRLQSSITDLARHITLSFGKQSQYVDQRFDGIDTHLDGMNSKLDAIMESVVVRKEMHNLVH